MKKIHYLITFSLLIFFMITGCAPPTTGTKGSITINVTRPTANEWAYVISTSGTSNISKVVFTLTISGCSVKSMPTGWRNGPVSGGIQVESAAGAQTVNITLECDASDGPIYVDVHVLGGAATTIGPISGPT